MNDDQQATEDDRVNLQTLIWRWLGESFFGPPATYAERIARDLQSHGYHRTAPGNGRHRA